MKLFPVVIYTGPGGKYATRRPFVKRTVPTISRIPAANPTPPPLLPSPPARVRDKFSPQHRHYPLLRNNYCRSCINERETKTSTLHRSWTTVPQLLSRLICDERRTKGGRSLPPDTALSGFDRPETVSCSEE